MQRYEEDLDEEAGYDDYYSNDELDEYEDDEEEEERKPPKEELEYLELRQKLKDKIRKNNMGKGSQSSLERKRKLPYNNFGSFFGPSQPVIASRVIQESKSVLENEIRTGRTSTSNQPKKRPVPTSGSGSKGVVSHEKQRTKVVNEVRRKVEVLKGTRDYSFLLSDDAELPVPKKEPLSRSSSFPSSEAQSAQLSARPKPPSGINGRTAHGPPREEKRPVAANGHSRPSGSQLVNHSRPSTSGSHMQNPRLSSSSSQMQSRSVSGRPPPSGSQMQSSRPASGTQMQQRAASTGIQRPGSSTNRQEPMRPPVNRQSANRNGQLNSRSDSHRSAPAKVPVDHHRKQMSINSNGVGPARSVSSARPLPAKTSLERRPPISAGKSSLQNGQRPPISRQLSADPRQRVAEQRKVSRDPMTSRTIPKQSMPASRQMMSRPAPKRPPPRDLDDDRRPMKRKPARRSSDDDMALDMIRRMFKTDRFAGREDDDINMEANYEDIQREERRSARIAREEDEREAQLEAEEEERKRRKSRKLGH